MNKKDINQIDLIDASIKDRYKSIIESLLFMSGEPLNIKEISSIIECDIDYTRGILNNMKDEFEKDNRGIKLIQLENNLQLVTKEENSNYVQKLLKTNVRQSLSQAALETLAIVSYKQPITRIDIDEIRGVKSDRAIQTLVEKKLIKECGRLEVPGKPILYGTTEEFLKHFGLESLKELPSLEQILDEFKEEGNEEAASSI
ncbi:SMC-Scp complex subunit ScpB [Clostridium peptidivorans]|uniref:SMC-Scp complex subunit ScpB n=1 Tax=Clostridium peptidivorans TaxID=100174 RepID=UPI000BE44795|nr:SMC-Scp complex subunit ScpB [Clostridium peptidivorans]